jgi:PEP-CTERM motif-containing protein
MRSRSLFLLPLSLVIPAAAVAAGAPFPTPVIPDVPLGPVEIEAPPAQTPPVAAPPVDVVLPERPELPELPVGIPQGPPDPLPSVDAGIPDLVGVVDLPDGALDHVLDQAPPFGGEHGSRFAAAVPEPTSAVLIASGLLAIAWRRRGRA